MSFKNKIIQSHQGFSLVEILVALALMAVVFTLVPFSFDSDKSKMEEALESFERAVKYASSEAILRNTVTRILIDNSVGEEDADEDKPVVTFSVQFGPSTGVLLPPAESIRDISLSELEEFEKKQKKFHSKFNNIEDFANEKLPEGVEFEGLATSYQKEIQIDGKLSIYFYPTGEKDDALIVISNRTEVASFEVLAFKERIKKDFITIPKTELDNREGFIDNKMKELYDSWIKD